MPELSDDTREALLKLGEAERRRAAILAELPAGPLAEQIREALDEWIACEQGFVMRARLADYDEVENG